MYFSTFDTRIWITTECLGSGPIPLDFLPVNMPLYMTLSDVIMRFSRKIRFRSPSGLLLL